MCVPSLHSYPAMRPLLIAEQRVAAGGTFLLSNGAVFKIGLSAGLLHVVHLHAAPCGGGRYPLWITAVEIRIEAAAAPRLYMGIDMMNDTT